MTFSRRSSSFVAISTVLPIVTTKSLLFLIVESESVGQIESAVRRADADAARFLTLLEGLLVVGVASGAPAPFFSRDAVLRCVTIGHGGPRAVRAARVFAEIESVVSYSTLSLGADLGSSARAGGGAWRKLDVIRRWADSHVKH